MLLGIDHLVVAVPDPDAAAAELERGLGLRASGGGRHPGLGTFNRLIWLGDTFVELIGVFDREQAEASWIGAPALRALEAGGGLATWAVATDSLDREVAAARASGIECSGPIDGERIRPDGRVVRWRLAAPGRLGPAEPPFWIEHHHSAAEWTPAERAERQAATHPIGGHVRLSGLEIEVADPAGLARRLGAVLGARIGTPPAATAIIADQWLRLRSPTPGTSRAWPLATLRLMVSAAIPDRVADLAGCRFSLSGVDGENPPGPATP